MFPAPAGINRGPDGPLTRRYGVPRVSGDKSSFIGGVRAISYSIPSTWGTKAIAGVNQMGLSLNEVWGDVAMMLILGVVYTLLGFGVGFLRNSVALRGMFRKRRA